MPVTLDKAAHINEDEEPKPSSQVEGDRSSERRRSEKEDEVEGRDEVCDGVRREPDPTDDGGPEEEGRDAAEAPVRGYGAVREGEGLLEPSASPLRPLEL